MLHFEDAFAIEKLPKRKKNLFKGEVAVLTGSMNASLAFYFPLAVKNYNIGTLIGHETGGNLRGVNGGQLLFMELPTSGIVVQFPIMGGFKDEPLPNQGISPDIAVSPSFDQLQNGEDAVLQRALKWAD